MSWAALVKAPAAASTPEAPAAAPLHESRVAVVDANAIISGLSLAGLAERYVTIQEVLDEVRDKHARQVLATLPFSLEVKEPEPASLTAGACALAAPACSRGGGVVGQRRAPRALQEGAPSRDSSPHAGARSDGVRA